MADRTIDIDIVAHDYATNVFRNVTGGLGSFQSGLNTAFGRANYMFRSFNNAMRGISNTAVNALKTAGSAIYNFTEDSIVQFAKLESTMARTMGVLATGYNFNWSNIQKGTGTTTDNAEYTRFIQDRQALTQQTYRLAISGPSGDGSFYNPEEIASAQYELSKGGITAEQMLANDDALTKAVTVFAGANGLDMADAVSYGIQLGAQYDMGTDQWMDMFDMVTWAANQTPNTSVEDMMQALQKVGNVAHGYGVSLEDTLTSLIIMGHSGLKGSQAGSGLATTLTRGISPTGISTAGAPPTENVEEIYNQFKDSIVDENGMFVGMNDYVDMLADVESQLTDQEKAWFNKKLFGLYQTKTALALSKDLGTDIDDESVFSTLSEQLSEQHEDSNQLIYDMVLDSTSGQIEALQNTWDATKMRVGEALKPVTMEVTKQLRQGLETGDFSNIDWDAIRTAVDEAAQNIGDMFGPDAADMMIKISEFVKTVGDFLVNAGQVASVEAPLLGGTFEALVKLLNGDFEGAWDTFTNGIEDTNTAIEGLPEELQGTATAAKNLIIMFEGLLALNVVTKVGEVVTALGGLATALNIWKIAHSLTGKGNVSANINATSPNTVVNTTNAQINAGAITTATFGQVGNMTVASASLINITANIVNVYGGVVNNMGGGGSGGTPQLGGGGYTPILPGGGGYYALPGNGLFTPQLGAGASSFWSSFFGSGTGTLFGIGAGSAATYFLPQLYNMLGLGAGATLPALESGATLMLPEVAGAAGAGGTAAAGGIAGSALLGTALKALGTVGMVIALTDLLTMPAGYAGLPADEVIDLWSKGQQQGVHGKDLTDWINKESGWLSVEGVSVGGNWWGYTEDFQSNFENFFAFMNSAEGMQDFYDALDNQYISNGKITEDFLNNYFTDKGFDTHGGLGQWMLQAMANNMFDAEYTPGHYTGEYADSSFNKFWKEHMNDTNDWSANGTIAQWMAIINGRLDNMTAVAGTDNVYQNQYGEYFRLLENGTIENVTADFNTAVTSMHDASISLQDAANYIVQHPEIIGQSSATNADAITYLSSQLGVDPTLLTSLSSMNISLDTLVAAVVNGISDPELKEAFNTAWGNFESVIAGDMETLSSNVISLSEAVQMALENDKIDVLGLGQGPLSDQGAYDYIMGQLYSGQSANGTLLSNILSGINAIDPTLAVDITQPAPHVDVKVNVNVDKSGNATQNVITDYSGADSWTYRASQRYGSTINLQR